MGITKKYIEVPVKVVSREIMVNASKSTTCKEVVSQLTTSPTKKALFAVIGGNETQLSGKTKLLKIWSDKYRGKKVELILKKSHSTKYRLAPHTEKRKGDTNASFTTAKKMRDRLKKVSDLAFYVRYQKSKLNDAIKKQNAVQEEQRDGASSALMDRIMANASANSMDVFLAKADLGQMAQFLSFCRGVTDQHLQGKERKQVPNGGKPATSGKSQASIVRDSLSITKLGFRQQMGREARENSSTTTLSSQDTGYSSSSKSSGQSRQVELRSSSVPLTKGPRYSTPLLGHCKRRSINMDTTLNSEDFDEAHGKDVILQRFMDAQTATDSSQVRRRNKRHSISRGRTIKYTNRPHLRVSSVYPDLDKTINENNELDESSESLFDKAFIDETTFNESDNVDSSKKTLRRESAISNLNNVFAMAKTREEDIAESESFDYSFDCSFQSMLEAQSMDFTYSCDDSSEGLSERRQSAEFMCSFAVFEQGRQQAGYGSGSDEGLGSLSGASDSGSRTELL